MLLCTQGVMSTNNFFAAQHLEIYPSCSGGSPMASAPPAAESGGRRSSCSPLTTAGTGDVNKWWPTCRFSCESIRPAPLRHASFERVASVTRRPAPRCFAKLFTSNETRSTLSGRAAIAAVSNGSVWCLGMRLLLDKSLGLFRGTDGRSNDSRCLPWAV